MSNNTIWIHCETKILMSQHDYNHLSTKQKSKMIRYDTKLYTEEQVRKIVDIYVHDENILFMQVLEQFTPIELPTDEEIEEFSYAKYMEVEDSRWFEPLKVGAKWMKSKIQGGNNEPKKH